MAVILGVLNVTPDSFSDGGRFDTTDAAIAHGMALARDGADIVDVGGESTRPGAERVPADREQARVLPVIRALAAEGVRVSVDTMNAETARVAVEAGAALVNDVSGGLADPLMASTAAELDVPFIAMHWRGHSTSMDDLARYDDVVADVCRELAARVDALTAAGVRPKNLVLDPGLGFAKTREHDWQLLGRLEALMDLGFPVLIGASRKRTLAELLPERGYERGTPARQSALDTATAAVSALAGRQGVWGVRVHDVAGTRLALAVSEAWRRGELGGASERMEP